MSYPKIILTKRIRKGINIFLVLLFFIISPSVIFYTTGYRYDFETHEIRQTGVISIDIEPKDSKVLLDNIAIDKKIPIRLANRAPGVYNLKIFRDGYYNWEKDIVVESKQTSYIKDLTLYKKSTPVVFFTLESDTKEIFSSYDGRYLAISSQDGETYTVDILETDTRKRTTIIRSIATKKPYISWSKYSNFLAIEVEDKQNSKIYILSAANLDNITQIEFEKSHINQKIQWKDSVLPTIFVKDLHTIKQLNLTGTKIVKESVAYDKWFIDEKNNVWTIEKNILKNLNNLQSNYELNIDQNNLQIIDINETRAIVQNNQETLIVYLNNQNSEYKKNIKTENIFYNELTQNWISWSTFEIWSIDKNGNLSLTNRTSEEIKDVKPMDKYGVLSIINKKGLVAFNPHYYINTELYNNNFINIVAINQKNKFFILKEENTNNLLRLNY